MPASIRSSFGMKSVDSFSDQLQMKRMTDRKLAFEEFLVYCIKPLHRTKIVRFYV